MRKLTILLLLLLLGFAATAGAQTQHFTINVNAASFGGKDTKAVSLVGGAFQLTKNVSVGYFSVSDPTDSSQPRYHLAVANYTRELRSLIGKKLDSKLVFDTSNWLVTVQAGGGKVNYKGVDRVAEVGGIFLTRPVGNNVALQVGYQVLHGQGTSLLTRNITQQPTAGLLFYF